MGFSLKEKTYIQAAKPLIGYLDKDPEKNIPKLMKLAQIWDREKVLDGKIGAIQKAMEEQGNWYDFVKSFWTDIDDEQRVLLFENFVVNGNMISDRRRTKAMEKYNCNVPWAILMDPTSACNLHCIGCWAAEYGNKLNMSYETLDDIVEQGKELGIFTYLFSGGEPTVRKDDIFKLCEKHHDCTFLAFTNGTMIDEDFVENMLRVKNFIPAVSVEGFDEATDMRRGKGTFARLQNGIKLMKENKLAFGMSCCYTSKNYDVIGSDEYFDWMIDMGAKFVWLFTYMPVGVNSDTDLMVTADQREYMYNKVREFRRTKPIFALDFWNDGEYIDGCIAGGRRYLHINANGDIEPCAFIHYSDSNIHEKTLIEALQGPLFQEYRKGQPFSDNMLRPCPLLDNKNRLAEMVEASGAHSTDLEHPEDVRKLCAKCHNAADNWKVTADEIWNRKTDEKQNIM